MKEKETKKNLEELKDRQIDEEALENVAGGTGDINAKKKKGSLKKAEKFIKS